MDFAKTNEYVDAHFEEHFIKPLSSFIEIPNLSPDYDQEFYTNGLINQAIDFVFDFADSLKIPGLEHHVYTEEGKAPMAFLIYPGNGKRNVMLYGHLDKQPHMDGWKEGTGPTSPVIIDNKLYGRGSSDDGYVPFFFLMSLQNALIQGQELPRLCLVLETEEESGSHDLVYLMDKNSELIGKPDICICCDSGCLNYDSVWLTSTLRGVLNFNLTVEVAEQGSHSGLAGGILPDTWRIINMLIARLEDQETGKVIEDFHVEISPYFQEEAKTVAGISGKELINFHQLDGVRMIDEDNLSEVYLNQCWRPSLTVTGVDGLPPTKSAGNVIRSKTTAKISIRLPPTLDSQKAIKIVQERLLNDPPYGAKVEIGSYHAGNGWSAGELPEWLRSSLDKSSEAVYGKGNTCKSYGVGGSIPFLATLGGKFPETEILAVGVGSIESNAHNPNEFIVLPYVKSLIKSISHVLVDCGK